MIIGVPCEVKAAEHRIGLLPSAAYQLTQRGHRVLVEASAGAGSGYPDTDYAEAGAELVQTHEAVFSEAELIVKVKEPIEEEWYGWRPMTSDGVPFIDRLPGLENAWVAAGHNMLGVSMAPATGQLIAQLLGGQDAGIDPAPYRIARA